MKNTVLRRSLDHWFEENDLRPKMVGEFEDSAMTKIMGKSGHGVFPVTAAITGEVQAMYGVDTPATIPGNFRTLLCPFRRTQVKAPRRAQNLRGSAAKASIEIANAEGLACKSTSVDRPDRARREGTKKVSPFCNGQNRDDVSYRRLSAIHRRSRGNTETEEIGCCQA